MLALATSAAYADTGSDAIRGAIIGAIIGNNIGDGDAKSGAVIGAISGVIAGSKHHRHYGQDYHVRQHTKNHYHRHYCNCGVKTVRIEERYWIPEKVVRDSCGNVLYYEPGRYETSYKFRNVPVCR